MNQIPASQIPDFFLRLSPDSTQPLRGDKPPKVESQLEAWFKEIEAAKKTDQVFELEVWLQAVERFFALENQPLSQEVIRNITVKDFSEEMKILCAGVERMGHVVSLILSKGDASYSRFEDFLESSASHSYGVRPQERHIRRDNGFAEAMDLLGEALADFQVIYGELCRQPKSSFQSFLSAGRLLSREISRNGYLTYLLDRKFKPYYDRISNPYLCRVIYECESATTKRELARIYLEFFRLLRYLELIGRDLTREPFLKKYLLIFCLVRHEMRSLLHHIREKTLVAITPGTPLHDAIEMVAYAAEMEMKKVFQFEMIDFADAQSKDLTKIKVENAYNILKRAFQEAVVTLTQGLHREVRGEEIFDTYMTRQAQSIQLRRDLNVLFEQVRAYMRKRDFEEVGGVTRYVVDFQQSSLKYLMYKDWQDFDMFLNEIRRARSLPALRTVLHKFETFLASLLIEIGKRTVFINLGLESE